VVEDISQCIVTTEDYTVCWGGSIPYEPTLLEPTSWHPELKVKGLAIGENRICALLLDGRVYCQGSNAGTHDGAEGFVALPP
jgi:hypothetical protein